MKPVVFVLSAGRSGTVYDANILKLACAGNANVWHERLTLEAGARKYFRQYGDLKINECLNSPHIKEMVDSIHETSKEVAYIDTGWTLHSLFPLMISAFGDRVRFVYQIRHPFDCAASLAMAGGYQGLESNLSAWDEHCFLCPSDNVFDKDINWQEMSAFEKGLWRWGQLALYWQELIVKFPEVSWHVVKAEDIFTNPNELSVYFELLELVMPDMEKLNAYSVQSKKNESKKEMKYWLGLRNEWKKYYDYPWIIDLAEKYGYSSERDLIKNKYNKYKKPLNLFGRAQKKIQLFLIK